MCRLQQQPAKAAVRVLAGLCLLAGLQGCNTGAVNFVRYAGNSRYLLYSGEHSYIHQIASGRTVGFYAMFACEDSTGQRWVLEPMPLAPDQRLILVGVEADGALAARLLPPLPYPPPGTLRTIMVRFGPGQDEISLVSYRDHGPDPRAFRLKIGQTRWQELASGPLQEELREHLAARHANRPIAGMGQIPLNDFTWPLGKHVQSLQETNNWAVYRAAYRLDSPDGTTYTTIQFEAPRTPWAMPSGKLTLTDTASGKSRVLLGNTAVAAQFFQNWVYGPCAYVVVLPFIPRF